MIGESKCCFTATFLLRSMMQRARQGARRRLLDGSCALGAIEQFAFDQGAVAMPMPMSKLFYPRSVAVIGASERAGAPAGVVLTNMLQAGWREQLYPVHPKAEKVYGVPAFASMADVPDKVDCVVIGVAADKVTAAIKEAAACGARISSSWRRLPSHRRCLAPRSAQRWSAGGSGEMAVCSHLQTPGQTCRSQSSREILLTASSEARVRVTSHHRRARKPHSPHHPLGLRGF